MTIIGQVRIDTVLCKRPRQKKGRGRDQTVNYRTAVAKARFLNGQLVRFVWCEFEDDKGKKRPRFTVINGYETHGT